MAKTCVGLHYRAADIWTVVGESWPKISLDCGGHDIFSIWFDGGFESKHGDIVDWALFGWIIWSCAYCHTRRNYHGLLECCPSGYRNGIVHLFGLFGSYIWPSHWQLHCRKLYWLEVDHVGCDYCGPGDFSACPNNIPRNTSTQHSS